MISSLVQWLPSPLRKQVEHRMNLLRAAENTGWIIANNIVRLVIAMVVGVWVARYLGVEQYGLFNYAISFSILLRMIIPLGLNSLMVRDLAQNRGERNLTLGSAFAIQVVMAGLMFFVALGNAFLLQGDDPLSQRLTLIMTGTLFMSPFEILVPWFQSQLQAVWILIANTTSLAMMALMRVGLVYYQAPLEAFVFLLVLERVINIATMLYLYQKSGERIQQWHFSWQRSKNMARESMPLFWSTIVRTLQVRGTEILLRSLASPTALGYYAAANRITDLYTIVPYAIVNSATPIVSKARVTDRELYLRQLTNLCRITGVIGVASTLVVGLAANWLMPFIYGEEFAGASDVLSLSMWSTIPATFGLITGIWAMNEGFMHILFQRAVTTTVLTITLNWLLVPIFAAPGAAMSVLIASLITNVLWDFVDPRMRSLALIKLHAFMPWWFSLKNL